MKSRSTPTPFPSISLTDGDKRLLVPLEAESREITARGAKVLTALERRGYVRLSRGRCGPLGLLDGSTFASLTEAGRAVLAASRRTS